MARLVVIGAAQQHDRRSTAVVFVAEVDAGGVLLADGGIWHNGAHHCAIAGRRAGCDAFLNYVLRRLPEGEDMRLNAGVEERDLERAHGRGHAGG